MTDTVTHLFHVMSNSSALKWWQRVRVELEPMLYYPYI